MNLVTFHGICSFPKYSLVFAISPDFSATPQIEHDKSDTKSENITENMVLKKFQFSAAFHGTPSHLFCLTAT